MRKEEWPRRNGHGMYTRIILLFIEYIFLHDVVLDRLALGLLNSDIGTKKWATVALFELER